MASETRYFDCTPASNAGLGDWVQIEIASPPVRPVADGDVVVTHVASGEVLPHKVLANTSSRLRFTVALRSPCRTTVAQTVRVNISDAGTAHPGWFDWATGNGAGGASVGPTMVIRDGKGNDWNGGTPSDQWAHPSVQLVPAGSWMKFKDDAERIAGTGTVTHVRLDTPYPDGDDNYENPFLLYSTDDGATWAEWNLSVNPLAIPDAGGWNSDVGMVINAAGDLVCFYRRTGFHMVHRVVSGTSLANATAGPVVVPTLDMPSQVSPSVVVGPDGKWYLFKRGTGATWMRQESSDEGLTWTNPTTAIDVTTSDWVAGGAWAAQRAYWHGSAAGPFADGWYYLALSENPTGSAPGSGLASIRLFRTRDPAGDWQAARTNLLKPKGLGATSWYESCPYELSDGSLAVLVSGFNNPAYRVCIQPFAVSAMATSINEAAAFQWDTAGLWRVDSQYAVDGINRGTVTPTGAPPTLVHDLEYRLGTSGAWLRLATGLSDGTGVASLFMGLPAGSYQWSTIVRDSVTGHTGPRSTPRTVVVAAVGATIVHDVYIQPAAGGAWTEVLTGLAAPTFTGAALMSAAPWLTAGSYRWRTVARDADTMHEAPPSAYRTFGIGGPIVRDIAWATPEIDSAPGVSALADSVAGVTTAVDSRPALSAKLYLFDTEVTVPLAPELFLDNDQPVRVGAVERTRFTDYAVELATGLTDVTVSLSLTDDHTATPIDPALSLTLTEIGSTAVYSGGWQGDVLTTHLASHVDKVLYVIVTIGTGDFRAVGDVTVRARRSL